MVTEVEPENGAEPAKDDPETGAQPAGANARLSMGVVAWRSLDPHSSPPEVTEPEAPDGSGTSDGSPFPVGTLPHPRMTTTLTHAGAPGWSGGARTCGPS